MDSNITFYRDSQEVYYQSKRISLTKREFDLLYLLAKNENRIFSIEELYNYLYPVDSDAQLRSITEYIYQIRQNLRFIKLIQSKQYGEEDTNGKRIDNQATH